MHVLELEYGWKVLSRKGDTLSKEVYELSQVHVVIYWMSLDPSRMVQNMSKSNLSKTELYFLPQIDKKSFGKGAFRHWYKYCFKFLSFSPTSGDWSTVGIWNFGVQGWDWVPRIGYPEYTWRTLGQVDLRQCCRWPVLFHT